MVNGPGSPSEADFQQLLLQVSTAMGSQQTSSLTPNPQCRYNTESNVALNVSCRCWKQSDGVGGTERVPGVLSGPIQFLKARTV